MGEYRLLMGWAVECTRHILPLLKGKIDGRITAALQTGENWKKGTVKTGAAMTVSLEAHAVAKKRTTRCHRR